MNPTDQTRIAAYYDEYLDYLKRDHVLGNKRLSRVKVSLSAIVRPGQSILDLGCGTGITSQFMGQLGATVMAVDISPALIEFAREHSAHRNVEYLVADVTALEFDRTFDGIVMVDVFEHIPPGDISDLLAVIARHSGDKTWVFLNIPDGRYQAMARALIPHRLQIVDESYHLIQLLSIFRGIGFEAANIDIYGIDVACQYNSILFQRGDSIREAYKTMMSQYSAGKDAD